MHKKQLFASVLAMLIISRTPVRISFFGGGTDYSAYFLRHPGAVLGTTIDKYTHVSINTITPFFDHKFRISYSKTELTETIDDIKHPSIRECLRYMNHNKELEINIFSDLPAKTGLGSSSSFTVGFLNALHALNGKMLSKEAMAELACLVEQKRICENVGSQDQYHAAYGGLNIIEFGASCIQAKPVIAPKAARDELEQSLMLFYTGVTRFASDIVEKQVERTAKKDNDAFLNEMYAMVYEAADLLSKGDIPAFGKLMQTSWELKKKLSPNVSNPHIDALYEKAMQAGAYGGKLCGAGHGGFLAMLVPKERQKEVQKQVGLLEVKCNFEDDGSKIIYMKD